jgi:hypothetical protein
MTYLITCLKRNTSIYISRSHITFRASETSLFLLSIISACKALSNLCTEKHLQPRGRKDVGKCIISLQAEDTLAGLVKHPRRWRESPSTGRGDENDIVVDREYILELDVAESAIILIGSACIPPAFVSQLTQLREKKSINLTFDENEVYTRFGNACLRPLVSILGGGNERRLIAAAAYTLSHICAKEDFLKQSLSLSISKHIRSCLPPSQSLFVRNDFVGEQPYLLHRSQILASRDKVGLLGRDPCRGTGMIRLLFIKTDNSYT